MGKQRISLGKKRRLEQKFHEWESKQPLRLIDRQKLVILVVWVKWSNHLGKFFFPPAPFS